MSRDDRAGAKLDASAASFTFKPSAASFVPSGGASATPFYPTTQRSGYDEHLGQDQPRPETLPKKQSFADLGLDSLGFVSDEEGGDSEALDAASPLTKQRRDEVVQQLEGGMLLNNRRQQSGEYHQYHAQEYHPAQAQEYHPAQAQEYQEYHPAQAREYREFHPAQTSREYQAYYPGGYSGFDESDGGGEGYGGASDNEHMDEHEFLQFLMESYRGYSLESLTELLEANNGDIALTVEILSELDAEVEPPEPPALDDEELFPAFDHPQLEDEIEGGAFFRELLDRIRLDIPHHLRNEDRNSMAYGLEARPAFVDHELIELAWEFPYELFMENGINKRLMRRAMEGTVTPSVLSLEKKFVRPGNNTVLAYDQLAEPLQDMLHGGDGLWRDDLYEVYAQDRKDRNVDNAYPWFRFYMTQRWMKLKASAQPQPAAASPVRMVQ